MFDLSKSELKSSVLLLLWARHEQYKVSKIFVQDFIEVNVWYSHNEMSNVSYHRFHNKIWNDLKLGHVPCALYTVRLSGEFTHTRRKSDVDSVQMCTNHFTLQYGWCMHFDYLLFDSVMRRLNRNYLLFLKPERKECFDNYTDIIFWQRISLSIKSHSNLRIDKKYHEISWNVHCTNKMVRLYTGFRQMVTHVYLSS